jgi:hypothetical protein
LANNLTASLCRQEFHRACPIAETLAEHGLREITLISLIFLSAVKISEILSNIKN